MNQHPDYLLDRQNATKAANQIIAAYQGKHKSVPDNVMTKVMIENAAKEWCVSEDMIKEFVFNPEVPIDVQVPLYEVARGSIVRTDIVCQIYENGDQFHEFTVISMDGTMCNAQYKNYQFKIDATIMVQVILDGNDL